MQKRFVKAIRNYESSMFFKAKCSPPFSMEIRQSLKIRKERLIKVEDKLAAQFISKRLKEEFIQYLKTKEKLNIEFLQTQTKETRDTTNASRERERASCLSRKIRPQRGERQNNKYL